MKHQKILVCTTIAARRPWHESVLCDSKLSFKRYKPFEHRWDPSYVDDDHSSRIKNLVCHALHPWQNPYAVHQQDAYLRSWGASHIVSHVPKKRHPSVNSRPRHIWTSPWLLAGWRDRQYCIAPNCLRLLPHSNNYDEDIGTHCNHRLMTVRTISGQSRRLPLAQVISMTH